MLEEMNLVDIAALCPAKGSLISVPHFLWSHRMLSTSRKFGTLENWISNTPLAKKLGLAEREFAPR
jgi:hypothetical protein